MPFQWANGWNTQPDHNNGASQDDIIFILATANDRRSGDAGLAEALVNQSSQVTVTKGVHQFNPTPHITVDYLGALWHVNLVSKNNQNHLRAWRVSTLTQAHQTVEPVG